MCFVVVASGVIVCMCNYVSVSSRVCAVISATRLVDMCDATYSYVCNYVSVSSRVCAVEYWHSYV